MTIFNGVRGKDIILSLSAGATIGIFFLLVAKNLPVFEFIGRYKIYTVLFFTALSFAGFLFVRVLTNITNVKFFLQFGMFGLVGVLNTMIDFGILNLLIAATGIISGVGIAILNVAAFSVALINSFFWNRLWVFEDKEHSGNTNEFLQFALVSLVAVGINTAVVYLTSTVIQAPFGMGQIAWINLGKVAATVFSMIWNFVGYKFFVFKS